MRDRLSDNQMFWVLALTLILSPLAEGRGEEHGALLQRMEAALAMAIKHSRPDCLARSPQSRCSSRSYTSNQ